MAFINSENAKGHTYVLGINQFTDLSHEEFVSQVSGYSRRSEETLSLGKHVWDGVDLAASVDWSEKGAVTPVKNQGSCGSCWSFSTTGSLEGAWQISRGQLESLSEQQFMDCDKGLNRGCNGGSMDFSLRWAKSHDLCTEASYGYEARNGACRSQNCQVAISKHAVTGVKDVAAIPELIPASEKNLMSAVAQQPVSVAVAAGNDEFQHYAGGVLSGHCGSSTPPKPDHGVLVVGYGSDPAGGDYWKVKNSWGTGYGEAGFIRLQRGGTDKYGLCGILMNPVYPVVSSSDVIV